MAWNWPATAAALNCQLACTGCMFRMSGHVAKNKKQPPILSDLQTLLDATNAWTVAECAIAVNGSTRTLSLLAQLCIHNSTEQLSHAGAPGKPSYRPASAGCNACCNIICMCITASHPDHVITLTMDGSWKMHHCSLHCSVVPSPSTRPPTADADAHVVHRRSRRHAMQHCLGTLPITADRLHAAELAMTVTHAAQAAHHLWSYTQHDCKLSGSPQQLHYLQAPLNNKLLTSSLQCHHQP
jgi:hypothetical protein